MRWLAVGLGVLVSACVEPALPGFAPGAVADAGTWTCSPMTCTGCCVLNTCLGGNLDTACGYAGRACGACSQATECVSPGTCVGLPSDGGAFNKPLRSDAGIRVDGFQRPLERPRRCVWVGGRLICY